MTILTFNPRSFHNKKHIDFENFGYCISYFESRFAKPITFNVSKDESIITCDLVSVTTRVIHKIILHYFSAVYACRNKEPTEDYSNDIESHVKGIHYLLLLTQQTYFISREYRRYCTEVSQALDENRLTRDEYNKAKTLSLSESYILLTLDVEDKFWFVDQTFKHKHLVKFVRLHHDTNRYLMSILKALPMYSETFASLYMQMHELKITDCYFDEDFADSTSEIRWKFITEVLTGKVINYDDVLSLYYKSMTD